MFAYEQEEKRAALRELEAAQLEELANKYGVDVAAES